MEQFVKLISQIISSDRWKEGGKPHKIMLEMLKNKNPILKPLFDFEIYLIKSTCYNKAFSQQREFSQFLELLEEEAPFLCVRTKETEDNYSS